MVKKVYAEIDHQDDVVTMPLPSVGIVLELATSSQTEVLGVATKNLIIGIKSRTSPLILNNLSNVILL